MASVGSETRITPSTPKSSPSLRIGVSTEAAWELTRAFSPRNTVRVAAVDAYGVTINLYTGRRRIEHRCPERPWAVYLADDDENYRLLGFDLDAKGGTDMEAAAQDAQRLAGLLTELGIDHIVCASGPSGGRHVWVATADPVPATIVHTIAYLARDLCPSLDLSPLTNPATGCLRPPGAPHRDGGASDVLQGEIRHLYNPTTTAAQIDRLVAALTQRVVAAPGTRKTAPGAIAYDSHGHPFIPGVQRALPAYSTAAVKEPAALGDASSVLWRVLLGAAAAHWRFEDVAALAEHAPGLEHVRSLRDRSSRTSRPSRGPSSPRPVLIRQWTKAVHHVAQRGGHTGDDPTFDRRAGDIAAAVRSLQERARTAGGRWLHGGGPSDRRVLDVLCLLALQAVSTSIEADIRRVALTAGIGRETARTALLRLAAEGWISRARDPEGPHGAHWSIDPKGVLHRDTEDDRSQADPRPAGAALRSALTRELSTQLSAARHDVFTRSPGIGLLAGNVFSFLSETPLPLEDVAVSMGVSATQLVPTIERLEDQGLVAREPAGWRRLMDRRDIAAVACGRSGVLQARSQRYALERELWAWWQAEQTWMEAPRRTDDSRRPRPGQVALLPVNETNVFGAHPRRTDGRADFRHAREILTSHPAGARPLTSDQIKRRRPRAA